MPVRHEVINGFWVGIGFALAVLVWGVLQMLLNRGRH